MAVKLVFIGDGGVGKSSLISRFVAEGFEPRYKQTIGFDVYDKNDIQIWDVGGQSLTSRMLQKYVASADAVLIVYDLTSPDSLLNVDDWLRVRGRATYLVGNKSDALRQVSDDEHKRFWQDRGMNGGFITSAATGDNVTRVVYDVAARAKGIRLSPHQLDAYTKVVPVRIDPRIDRRTSAETDAIEAEDLAAERRKNARRCCAVS